jgi:hypothetical protein
MVMRDEARRPPTDVVGPPCCPPIYIVIPDHSSFSVLRETHMTFACDHLKKLKFYLRLNFFIGGKEHEQIIVGYLCAHNHTL